MTERGRRIAANVLVVVASVLVVLAVAAGYARWAVFDSDQFADRAAAALRDDSMRSRP